MATTPNKASYVSTLKDPTRNGGWRVISPFHLSLSDRTTFPSFLSLRMLLLQSSAELTCTESTKSKKASEKNKQKEHCACGMNLKKENFACLIVSMEMATLQFPRFRHQKKNIYHFSPGIQSIYLILRQLKVIPE